MNDHRERSGGWREGNRSHTSRSRLTQGLYVLPEHLVIVVVVAVVAEVKVVICVVLSVVIVVVVSKIVHPARLYALYSGYVL